MKKFLFPVLAGLALVSCSQSETIQEFNDPAEINFNVGIISSRSAISSNGSGLLTDPTSLNVYFVRASDKDVVDWSTVGTTAQSVAGFGAGLIGGTIDANGKVTFKDSNFTNEVKQYYNADPALYSHLVGFYPSATLSVDAGATVATWDIDGKSDVIVSNYVNGKKGDAAKELTFKHLLTWLVFNVEAENQAAKDVWGDVVSVKIRNIYPQITSTFNGTNYNYAHTGTKRTLDTFTATDGVPDIKPLPVSPTSSSYFSQAMVHSGEPSFDVEIVTTKNATPTVVNVKFAGDANATQGSRHIVTLTFRASEITANAKVTAWENGAPGSANVD